MNNTNNLYKICDCIIIHCWSMQEYYNTLSVWKYALKKHSTIQDILLLLMNQQTNHSNCTFSKEHDMHLLTSMCFIIYVR